MDVKFHYSDGTVCFYHFFSFCLNGLCFSENNLTFAFILFKNSLNFELILSYFITMFNYIKIVRLYMLFHFFLCYADKR